MVVSLHGKKVILGIDFKLLALNLLGRMPPHDEGAAFGVSEPALGDYFATSDRAASRMAADPSRCNT